MSGGGLGGHWGDGDGGGFRGGCGGDGGCDGGMDGGGGDGLGGGMSIEIPSVVMCTPTTSGVGLGANSPADAIVAVVTTAAIVPPSRSARVGEHVGTASARL